jgi:hypothetical protein
MPASRYFFDHRLPSPGGCQRAADIGQPDHEIATAPSAEVVVMPMPASIPFGSIGPHISVTMAGKWAVTKAS